MVSTWCRNHWGGAWPAPSLGGSGASLKAKNGNRREAPRSSLEQPPRFFQNRLCRTRMLITKNRTRAHAYGQGALQHRNRIQVVGWVTEHKVCLILVRIKGSGKRRGVQLHLMLDL